MKSSLKFSIRVSSKLNDIINILIFVKSLPKPLCPPVQCFAVFLFEESSKHTSLLFSKFKKQDLL